jgi:hypothetical protein
MSLPSLASSTAESRQIIDRPLEPPVTSSPWLAALFLRFAVPRWAAVRGCPHHRHPDERKAMSTDSDVAVRGLFKRLLLERYGSAPSDLIEELGRLLEAQRAAAGGTDDLSEPADLVGVAAEFRSSEADVDTESLSVHVAALRLLGKAYTEHEYTAAVERVQAAQQRLDGDGPIGEMGSSDALARRLAVGDAISRIALDRLPADHSDRAFIDAYQAVEKEHADLLASVERAEGYTLDHYERG